jgi:NAD(P)-dependent dehydrogenase (short-subunit alcohol dehydrogenase family)
MEDAVVITGAAGGKGAAITRAFAEEARSLILCDLHAASLEELAKTLPGKGSVPLSGAMNACPTPLCANRPPPPIHRQAAHIAACSNVLNDRPGSER